MKNHPKIYDIPKTADPVRCRGCGAPVYWIETPDHQRMACNADGTGHFTTCPRAGKFRRR